MIPGNENGWEIIESTGTLGQHAWGYGWIQYLTVGFQDAYGVREFTELVLVEGTSSDYGIASVVIEEGRTHHPSMDLAHLFKNIIAHLDTAHERQYELTRF